MISAHDNCLFFHVPKVAGQSIESVFLKRAGLTWEQRGEFLLRPNYDPKLGPPRLAHLLAREYVSLGYIDQTTFNQMFKFSFVRNPFARLVSEYRYRGYKQSFEVFVKEHLKDTSLDNYQTGYDGFRHLIPQVDFIYDEGGSCLADFVGRFENLDSDFAHVSKQITGESLLLPKKNETKNKTALMKKLFTRGTGKVDYRTFYNNDTYDIVKTHYQVDLITFGYDFD